ncbi:MAG: hypothetical protein ACQERC_09920 [Bacteroidota bacterium]
MAFHVFKESEVRSAIEKKAPCTKKSGKRSKHDTAFLMVNDKKVSHFRIPNNHKNEFRKGKAKAMAGKLFLDESQYKSFVDCTLKKKEYKNILEKKFPDKEGKQTKKKVRK